MKTILIETFQLENFKKRFALATKKIQKMGFVAPTYTVGETKEVTRTIHQSGCSTDMMPLKPITYLISCTEVNLNIDETYKLAGWNLIGIVFHRENVVVPVDANDAKYPIQYGVSFNKCEHCGGVHGARNKSFIVRNQESVYKQVGSTCSREFLGFSPNAIMALQAELNIIEDEYDFDGDSGGDFTARFKDKSYLHGMVAVSVEDILKLANHQLSADGEYTKKEYEMETDRRGNLKYVIDYHGNKVRSNRGEATMDNVEKMIADEFVAGELSPEYKAGFYTYLSGMVIDTYDSPIYQHNTGEVIGYEKLPKNEFQVKIKALAEKEMIRKNEAVVVVVALNGYNQYLATQEKLKVVKHVGVVGEKFPVELTITDIKSGEGEYGTWYLWIMVDKDGSSVNKFGTINDKFVDTEHAQVGSVVKALAEIKEHKFHNSLPVTMLGRLSKLK